MDILNFNKPLVFEEFDEDIDFDDIESNIIHLRVQQRNTSKYLTVIEGLDPSIDIKKILKILKKSFATNGAILKENNKNILQLQGDQRLKVYEFLLDSDICKKENIKIHGF